MNALSMPRSWPTPAALLRECYQRQAALTLFAALMLALMLPAAIALGLDTREIRGVNVWVAHGVLHSDSAFHLRAGRPRLTASLWAFAKLDR